MRDLVLAFGMILGAGQAVGAAAPAKNADMSALRRLRAENNQAMAARDVERTMAIAADDYVLVAGNDAIHRTRADMQAVWTRAFADPTTIACVRRPDRFDIGDHAGVRRAAEIGSWECPQRTAHGQQRLFGRYLAHWTKRDGAWKVVSDNYVTLGCRGSCTPEP